MKQPTEIQGFEYDWLASDAEGYVAFFSTAGASYAPREFLADTDAFELAIDAILREPGESFALRSPAVLDESKNIWRRVAERGLFAFDGDPNGGPYRLVGVPSRPTRLSGLPSAAAAVASRIVFRHLRFTESEHLSESQLLNADSARKISP